MNYCPHDIECTYYSGLEARVAELEAALQPFTDPDNAPLMTLSDAWMSKLVEDARAVLAKGRAE